MQFLISKKWKEKKDAILGRLCQWSKHPVHYVSKLKKRSAYKRRVYLLNPWGLKVDYNLLIIYFIKGCKYFNLF